MGSLERSRECKLQSSIASERLDICVLVEEFCGVLDRISLWGKTFIKDKGLSQIERGW